MNIVIDYLIVFIVIGGFTLFARLLFMDVKSRCETLVRSWIVKNRIKVGSNDVSLHLFDYPLQATVTGIDENGVKREYILKLGGTKRYSFLKEAEVLRIDSESAPRSSQ